METTNQLEAWNPDSLESATDAVQSVFREGSIDVDPSSAGTSFNSFIVTGNFDIRQTSKGQENTAIDIIGARKLHWLSEVFIYQQPYVIFFV